MMTIKEDFEKSGPKCLTNVNWNDPNHQRSVAASLVQGVYVQQSDRKKNRSGHESLAPRWWGSFNFELHEELKDKDGSSIFGATYKLKSLINGNPFFVIAFRGTVLKSDTFVRDIKLDFKIMNDGLHRTYRYERGMQAVQDIVDGCGSSTKIWLAGHSLGSTLAMLVGKSMATKGINLDSFLFNPPFVSVPFQKLKGGKYVFPILWSLMTAGIAVLVGGSERKSSEELFRALSSWEPTLFVNSGDQICSEYEGYFKRRPTMKKLGLGRVENVATQHSIWTLFQKIFRKEAAAVLPASAIPSGTLVIHLNNHSPEIERVHGFRQRLKHPKTYLSGKWKHFRQAHGICQWWRAHLDLQTNRYEYDLPGSDSDEDT